MESPICELRYDDNFLKVKSLTWLPWVGKEYDKASTKVLIVAESHYTTEGDQGDSSSVVTRETEPMVQS